MNIPIYSKPIVILAGGSAVRFNRRDKGQILIGGKRMIDIILQNIQYKTNPLIISGHHDYGLKALVISDDLRGPMGPVGGIYSTWKFFKDKSSSCVKGFYTLAIDVPNPPANFLEKIYSASTSNISAVGLQQHPAHGWWRMEDLDLIFNNLSFNDSISLNKLAIMAGAKLVSWPKGDYFVNINNQSQLDGYMEII
jgi:molybdopterin-guanine dinucleotide biosynthesis protein A